MRNTVSIEEKDVFGSPKFELKIIESMKQQEEVTLASLMTLIQWCNNAEKKCLS